MNEQQFANRIRQALNEGSRVNGHLSARVAGRLREARERALEHRRPERAPALGWAQLATGGVIARFGGLGGFSLRLLLPTVLLVAGVIAIYGWHQEQRAADIVELDARLLTDELPLDAYLDRGFEAWLRKSSER
jgi:hypothetical protein